MIGELKTWRFTINSLGESFHFSGGIPDCWATGSTPCCVPVPNFTTSRAGCWRAGVHLDVLWSACSKLGAWQLNFSLAPHPARFELSQLFFRSSMVLPGLVWSKKRRAEAFVCQRPDPGVLKGHGGALLYARLCPQEQGGQWNSVPQAQR